MAALTVIVLAAAASLLFTPRGTHALQSGACRGCNVILITIDTLRADRVGAFGGPTGLTPNLDRLAGEGFRLTRAYTAAPLTLPSHASILTGVSPPRHGLRANGLFRLGPEIPTLATVLKKAGYATGAFVGSFVLDARFGLNRGFDEYDDRYGEKRADDPAEGAERRGDDVIKPALAWITRVAPGTQAPSTQAPSTSAPQHPAPFFAWVHLYDPHEPYRAPEPYRSRYQPYDAEVAYADAVVGRLLAGLPRGTLDRTLMMVVADHGESLGAHGERTHGVFAYDDTMRVPWIIWGGPSGSSDLLVRLIDLAPTMLDLAGVAVPADFEGRSIVASAGRPQPELPAAYFEAMDANLTRNWAPLTGLVTRTHKLIDLPIPELYDLAADPKETTNLFTRDPERARTLTALLRGMAAEFETRESAAVRTTLSADARQRLQALGYVASSANPGRRVYSEADDPKTLIGAANELNEALADFQHSNRARGMARAAAVMSHHPQFTTAAGVYASMQWDSGDRQGAITTLESLVRREIADQSVLVVLAGYLQEVGALDRAVGILAAVISAHPDYAEAYNSLGVVYARMGRYEEARGALRKVLEIDPTSAKAYENLGVAELRAGSTAAAEDDLVKSLALDPHLASARNALAAVYVRLNRRADAVAQWKAALDDAPRQFEVLYNLGTTLYDMGRHEEARPYLERFVREAPPARYREDIQRLTRLLSK